MFAHVVTAAFIALPILAQTAHAGACVRSYTIKEGDICDSISAAHNVSTYQLAAINVGVIDSACSNLTPGNTICLGYAGEDCPTTYVVAADDTCEGITKKTGVNSTILSLNNPQIHSACDNLYIGEVLCVASSVIVPPAPAGTVTIDPTGAFPVSTAQVSVSTAHVVTTSLASPAAVTATPIPVSSAVASVHPPVSSAVDDDDEDLPFCDEL